MLFNWLSVSPNKTVLKVALCPFFNYAPLIGLPP